MNWQNFRNNKANTRKLQKVVENSNVQKGPESCGKLQKALEGSEIIQLICTKWNMATGKKQN